MSSSHTVLVTGATGNTGSSTVTSLSKSHPSISIRALVRDSAKASAKFSGLSNVQVVQADITKFDDSLKSAFAGADVAVIILPTAENREEITKNFISAAKASGTVKHAVVLSVLSAGNETSIFGRQFGAVESLWKASGIAWTICRLPLFLENNYANIDSIKSTNAFYYPARPDSKYSYISTDDVGVAFAAIAAAPEKHVNQIYRLNGPDLSSNEEVAKIYSEVLGREIKFVQVPDEAAVDAVTKAGFPKWAAEGLVELWHLIDARDEGQAALYGDYQKITGTTGTSTKQFLTQIAGAFK